MSEIDAIKKEASIYGEHPGLLPIEIQNNFDIWMQNEMEKCVSSEAALRSRIQNMSTMIRLLDTFRKLREKEDWKEPSEETKAATQKIEEHIRFFDDGLWPQIQEVHEGIITDDKHPFIEIINNGVNSSSIMNHFSSADRIADSTDKLRELVENEQHALSYITRDMTKLTTRNEMVATMMSRRRQEETKRMVQNQIVR